MGEPRNISHWRIYKGAKFWRARSPPLVQFSFIFMQFLAKILPNNRIDAPPFSGWYPLLGNPLSATCFAPPPDPLLLLLTVQSVQTCRSCYVLIWFHSSNKHVKHILLHIQTCLLTGAVSRSPAIPTFFLFVPGEEGCTWIQLAQPKQDKTALDSGWAAWSKVKITCWSHLSGSEALWVILPNPMCGKWEKNFLQWIIFFRVLTTTVQAGQDTILKYSRS